MSVPDPRAAAVSAVIPVYNGEAGIEAAVASVWAQTQPPAELVVVDDGSTDGTPELLRRLGRSEPRIRVVTQPNGGEAAARNAGVRAARHPLIAFLDHDDVWRPDKLERQLAFLREHPELALAFTAYDRVEGRARSTIRVRDWDSDPGAAASALALSCVVTPSTVMVRRDALTAGGLFDESLRLSPDWMMWLRMVNAGMRLGYLDEPLTEYRWHGANISRSGRRVAETALVIFRRVLDAPDASPALRRRRRWVLARWHAISAEESLHSGRPAACLAHLARATALRPASVRPGWARMAVEAVVQLAGAPFRRGG
jgi:glycosyltransferase involved in cell wall biosynthesis